MAAVVLVVGGWLLWASRTEGGVSGRVGDGIDTVKRVTGLDDTDPTLRNASEAFGGVWDARGSYVVSRDELEVRAPEVDWASDLDWRECSGGRAVVIVVDTARGVRSRLLLDGESHGDVRGDVACPTDFADPVPWE